MEPFSTRLILPSRQVGTVLATLLLDKNRPYVTNFDPEWTTVTVTSEFKERCDVAESEIRLLLHQIQHKIKTRIALFHCVNVPLFCTQDTINHVCSVQELYNVEITFTDAKYSVQDFNRVLQSFSPIITRHLKNCLVATNYTQLEGERSSSPFTSMDYTWLYHQPKCSDTTAFLPQDSHALENLILFGGSNIVLSGKKCIVDFKEMKLMIDSGEILCLTRIPPFVELPQQAIKVNIRGLDSSTNDALLNLKQRLNSGLKTVPISCSFIPLDFVSNFEQQVINYSRQYCVEYSFTKSGPLSVLNIKGAQGYLDLVNTQIHQQVMKLISDFTSIPSQSRQEMVPSQAEASSTSQPCNWQPQEANCQFFKVTEGSEEWNTILKRMKETLPKVILFKLERIQNCTLWERYQLEAKQMLKKNDGDINEMLLFHGTRITNPYMIAKSDDGVDFRFSSQPPQRRLMWGTGAYFAVNASYSNHYSYKLEKNSRSPRQMMLISVLTGKSYDYGQQTQPELTKPPPCPTGDGRLFDTVKGETGGSVVYVVYDHRKSCPAYIITYYIP